MLKFHIFLEDLEADKTWKQFQVKLYFMFIDRHYNQIYC